MKAFRAKTRFEFVSRLCDHLHDRVPNYFAGLDPEAALAHVDDLVSRAEELGFRARNQIRRFAVVEAAASGHAGKTPPAWLAEIANRPRSSAPLRLLALEDALIHIGRTRPGNTP